MMTSDMGNASSSGDDPTIDWKARLTAWSTNNLPSATFPTLEATEVNIAADILSKDLAALFKLGNSFIASLTQSTAQCLFEVACMKDTETGLSFKVRESLVKIAEKKTDHLNFNEWADILGKKGMTDQELLYTAKAANKGDEDCLLYLRQILKGEETSNATKLKVRQLFNDYSLLSEDDE
ncbi:hypothetical protein [Candidatus Finniella inopinata]|uniref:Uncharacterized protein n=1 Tax=Candidatus Finniella inopinata TaxID=1696036 RepID=A0A4Q7DLJ4_9PROT|nr:hypothetical protein [Candidatus Finniella inopinata]RZI45596.1 hypothetical protein EQU50_06635 [Candidatus Finniella inopinata]